MMRTKKMKANVYKGLALRGAALLARRGTSKWPSESGPSMSVSFSLMVPAMAVPDTTRPMPGTLNVSSIWNEAGSSWLAGACRQR